MIANQVLFATLSLKGLQAIAGILSGKTPPNRSESKLSAIERIARLLKNEADPETVVDKLASLLRARDFADDAAKLEEALGKEFDQTLGSDTEEDFRSDMQRNSMHGEDRVAGDDDDKDLPDGPADYDEQARHENGEVVDEEASTPEVEPPVADEPAVDDKAALLKAMQLAFAKLQVAEQQRRLARLDFKEAQAAFKAADRKPTLPRKPTRAVSGSGIAERLTALLQRPGGVSVNELASTFNWKPHTARARLSGVKKEHGASLLRDGQTYRLV